VFTVRYVPKKVSQLSSKDSKVALIGIVTQRRDGVFVLDDGTARADIFFDSNVDAKTVRVFCSIADQKIKADSVQKLDGLDLDLFKRVEDLYSRYYV